MRRAKRLLSYLLIWTAVTTAAAQVPCSKTGSNAPPLVNDDYYPWPPPATLQVLANDSDVDLDGLSITSVSSVVGGTAVIAGDRRSISFTAASAATSGSLVYTVSDGVNSEQPSGTVRMQTSGKVVDFTYACTGHKCTFTSRPQDTAGARWYSWSFGDGTTKPNYTGVTIYKEYPQPGAGVSITYQVQLTIDYLDGSRGVVTKPVAITGLQYDVGYQLNDGGTVVGDTSGLFLTATFLSSTFPRNGSSTERYRYFLATDLPFNGDTDFGLTDPLGAGSPVSISRGGSFSGAGTARIWIHVRKEVSTNGSSWTFSQSWDVSHRTLQVVDRPPAPRFTATKNDNGSFTFDPRSSFDDRAELNPTDYRVSWDMGDGTYRDGPWATDGPSVFTHTFPRPGIYNVHLTIVDVIPGHTATVTNPVDVPNRPPLASFAFSCAGMTCSFDGSESSDEEDLARYDWGYGDGAGGSGQTSTRTFTAPGCYQVDLTVTDNRGAQGVTRRTVSVSNGQLARAGMLTVDAHAKSGTTTSNLNGILEPDEVVLVEPALVSSAAPGTVLTSNLLWWNGGGLPGIYSTFDGTANYGPTPPGALTNCWATGDCYAVSVNALPRPQLHWDGALAENNDSLGFHSYAVHIGNSFSDVPPSNPFYPDVEALLHWGVTTGCAPNQFCPGNATRRDFVVLLMRARNAKSGAQPPECTTPPFTDVPCSDPAAPLILQARNLGITSGCGGGNFCPDATLIRAEAAVLLINALGIVPAPCAQTFADVQCVATSTTPKYWAADFISELYRRGITGGCSANPLSFCPGETVRRDMSAAFLVRTFGLDIAFPQCPRGTVISAAQESRESPSR